jgi:hypothetical protein
VDHRREPETIDPGDDRSSSLILVDQLPARNGGAILPKDFKNSPSLRGRGLVIDEDDTNPSVLHGLAVAEEFFGAFDHNTLLANAVQSRAAGGSN